MTTSRQKRQQRRSQMAGGSHIHAFVGTAGEPVKSMEVDEDDGAPPPMPAGTRVAAAGPIGESRSLTPEEVEQRRNMAAAAMMPPVGLAAPAPGSMRAGPWQVVPTSGPEMRLKCLDLAVASGHTDPAMVMKIARDYLAFLMGEA